MSITNQTARVLELVRRFNKGEIVNIEKLIEEAQEDILTNNLENNLWINNDTKDPKPVSEKTIRGHNRKRKLLYGRSHLSSKSSKILNVKNPRFLHSI